MELVYIEIRKKAIYVDRNIVIFFTGFYFGGWYGGDKHQCLELTYGTVHRDYA